MVVINGTTQGTVFNTVRHFQPSLIFVGKARDCIHITSFFVTQKARVLQYTRLKRFFSDKHTSLFGAFVSCNENEF